MTNSLRYEAEAVFPQSACIGNDGDVLIPRQYGLTKFEYTAIEMMKGMISNSAYNHQNFDQMVNFSIIASRKLLNKMEEVQK